MTPTQNSYPSFPPEGLESFSPFSLLRLTMTLLLILAVHFLAACLSVFKVGDNAIQSSKSSHPRPPLQTSLPAHPAWFASPPFMSIVECWGFKSDAISICCVSLLEGFYTFQPGSFPSSHLQGNISNSSLRWGLWGGDIAKMQACGCRSTQRDRGKAANRYRGTS